MSITGEDYIAVSCLLKPTITNSNAMIAGGAIERTYGIEAEATIRLFMLIG